MNPRHQGDKPAPVLKLKIISVFQPEFGQELAGRAYTQEQKFGAEIIIASARNASPATANRTRLNWMTAKLFPRVPVIIASGAVYRKLSLDNVARFEGAGIYHGATFVESQLCRDEEVIVVGGGNSAGQAAVFLAQTSKCVHMLVRSSGLAATMSRYLIQRVENNSAIDLRTCTEIIGLQGKNHLERITWRDKRTGKTETREIRHVFVMAGAVPTSRWLDGACFSTVRDSSRRGRICRETTWLRRVGQ